MALVDINKVKEEAQKELVEEKFKKAKGKVKAKMEEIESARKAVRNLEIELEDIMADLGE